MAVWVLPIRVELCWIGCFGKSRQGSSMSSMKLFSFEPSLKESACRKITGWQPLLSIVLSLEQCYAVNLGNVLTWSSFPTWSQQITHRDVFWTVNARVEWVRSALRHPEGRTRQVLSHLADQGSWPVCACEGTLRPLTGQHHRYLGPGVMSGYGESKCS